ncbi:hypothetical protein ACYZT3_15870 [Pseudomonas sp. MDT1-16]|nr:hypothetical protein [Pseudomonas sp. AL03]MDI3271545.1 hypothetical protein [Pseudomonas sp. AL03]
MSTSSIRFINGTSSLGVLLLAYSAEGLCALSMDWTGPHWNSNSIRMAAR